MAWAKVPRCPKCGHKPNYIMSYTEGRYWIMVCASCGRKWKVLQNRYQKKGGKRHGKR